MVNKVEPAPGWPKIKGEYLVGDPKSCVVVATLGSHLDEKKIIEAGAGMAGICKTENIGIEKMVANIIANPNIRFLILCGAEVTGHLTGDAIVNLHKNGVKNNRIVGARGAIPYVQNLPAEAIERFRKQVEIVEMIGVEDLSAITAKVKECISKDPGAFPEPPMIVEIKEEGKEEIAEGEMFPIPGEIANIESWVRDIELKVKEVALLNKFSAGVYAGRFQGFWIGLTLAMFVLGILMWRAGL
ncbi:MAG: tetrahydromethanopterin S-methyltransferase subunit [Archaeoglobaceae archaeon]|nr:tetrahydromethanopterin S-methyltransferase subunit [Archaeoglobaceae archaeon]